MSTRTSTRTHTNAHTRARARALSLSRAHMVRPFALYRCVCPCVHPARLTHAHMQNATHLARWHVVRTRLAPIASESSSVHIPVLRHVSCGPTAGEGTARRLPHTHMHGHTHPQTHTHSLPDTRTGIDRLHPRWRPSMRRADKEAHTIAGLAAG